MSVPNRWSLAVVVSAVSLLGPDVWANPTAVKVRFADQNYIQVDPSTRLSLSVAREDLINQESLIVRILPGDFNELRHRYFGRKQSGCLVFDSIFFEDAIDPDGFIDLRKRLSVAWLRKDKNGKPMPTRYTIVVERNPRPSRQVLIQEQFLFRYMQSGITIVLVPPPEAPPRSSLSNIIGGILAFTSTSLSAAPAPRPNPPMTGVPRRAPRVVGTVPKASGPPEPECIVAVR